MKRENCLRVIDELAAAYPDATTTAEGARTFVKIHKVFLPDGCLPAHTSALVVLDEGAPTPQLYIKVLPTLRSGAVPRSTSAASLAGETWQTFSFNQPWHEDMHTARQFVEGRLRRFALNE